MKTIATICIGKIDGVICHKTDDDGKPLFGIALYGGDHGYGEHIRIGTRPHIAILRETLWQQFCEKIGEPKIEVTHVPEFGMVTPHPHIECPFSIVYHQLLHLLVTEVFREFSVGIHAGLKNHFMWFMECGNPDILIRACANGGVLIEVKSSEKKWWPVLTEYSYA